jgi:hypothetical protein
MSSISFAIFIAGTVGLTEIFGHHRSPVVVAVFVAVWVLSFVYAMYVWLAGMRYGDPFLVKRGVKGTAQVLSAKETSVQMAAGEYYGIGAPNVWKYGPEVSLPGKDPYKTILYICARLHVGATVPVAASQLNRKRSRSTGLSMHALEHAGPIPPRLIERRQRIPLQSHSTWRSSGRA